MNTLSPIGKIPASVLLFYIVIIAIPVAMTLINNLLDIWIQNNL